MSPAKVMPRMKQESARRLSKRTQIVWAAFFTTIASAMFVLQLGVKNTQNGRVLTKLASVEERPKLDPLFSFIDNVEDADWTSIVIHHLGQPAGTAEQIDRNHRNIGLNGLGYHFLIGNGNGISDGNVHIGYRWDNQSSGARLSTIDTTRWDSVISICLVGNGNRRPFSDRQLLQLSRLVQRLQVKYSIPTSEIRLANELDDGFNSPGRYFAEAQFRSQLMDIPASN